jgi:hypothetical protein
LSNEDHDSFWNSLRKEPRPPQQAFMPMNQPNPRAGNLGTATKQSRNPFPNLLEGGPNEIFNNSGSRDVDMNVRDDHEDEF